LLSVSKVEVYPRKFATPGNTDLSRWRFVLG
jgi:hypothetical protein